MAPNTIPAALAGTLTPDRLANITAREAAATKGPWKAMVIDADVTTIWAGGDTARTAIRIGRVVTREDAAFIAAAREDVPALLAEVERQAKRIAELEGRPSAPQPPGRRPVDPNSRAARLAWLIAEKFPKDAMTEPVDGETLTVYVTPVSLGDWDWWLGRFHVQAGQTTHRGSYTTAKGNHGHVKVLLTGHGVPALYAAEAAGGAL